MRKETKSTIYMDTARPIMAYALEASGGTKEKHTQILEANEMKALRKIVGNIKDRIIIHQFREFCCILSINEWAERRRREWDEHVTGMGAQRLVNISRDNIPAGRRSPGRPKRR